VFGAATIAMKRVKAKSDADAQFTLKAQIWLTSWVKMVANSRRKIISEEAEVEYARSEKDYVFNWSKVEQWLSLTLKSLWGLKTFTKKKSSKWHNSDKQILQTKKFKELFRSFVKSRRSKTFWPSSCWNCWICLKKKQTQLQRSDLRQIAALTENNKSL
jgi:hypothetical protein